MKFAEREYLIKKSFETFKSNYVGPSKHEEKILNYWLKKIKSLDQMLFGNNRFFMMFSHVDFFPVFISDNFKHLMGYHPSHLVDKGLVEWFKLCHPEQLVSLQKIVQWGHRFEILNDNKVEFLDHRRYACGIKVKNFYGEYKIFFYRQRMLHVNNKNEVVYSFIEVEDITHLYEKDFFWKRHWAKNKGYDIRRVYWSSPGNKESNELITPREKEILQLVNNGMNVKEISEELRISENTVKRHRKNMIGRVGVKDMTALLHICILAEVI